MGMFDQSRRPSFKPAVYQSGRRNRRLPRWLVLLSIGVALGAGGVIFLQTNYGPPRLTAEQSEQLRSELNSATIERQHLQAQIDELQRKLGTNHAGQAQSTQDAAQLAPAPAAAAPVAAVQPEPAAPVVAPAPVSAPAPAPVAAPQAMPRMPSMPTMPTMPSMPAMPSASDASASMPQAPAAIDSPEVAAAPKPPVVRRPAAPRRTYEEPHSELRMTVIPAKP